MKKYLHYFLVCALLVAFPNPSIAQPAQPYVAPDADLWAMMSRAFDDLPMSFAAHQQIQQIMANVQREAQIREARARAQAQAEAKK